MAMAGFLPFSAIYIELYYIFASIWGHKVYTIYSILFIVFLILIVVTAFITIALTYFQLAVEDHRWWWRSFMCGGSTAFFVLGYCFFYYHYRCVLVADVRSKACFLAMCVCAQSSIPMPDCACARIQGFYLRRSTAVRVDVLCDARSGISAHFSAASCCNLTSQQCLLDMTMRCAVAGIVGCCVVQE
jgi:hypothetical protein